MTAPVAPTREPESSRDTGLDTSNGLEFVQQRIALFAKIIGHGGTMKNAHAVHAPNSVTAPSHSNVAREKRRRSHSCHTTIRDERCGCRRPQCCR